MKKYRMLIVLVVVIVASFSFFYVNNKKLSKNFPQFSFHKVEGDDQAVDSLVINGDLYMGMFNNETFRVEKQGTTYLRNESFLKRITGYYQPLEIEKLQKEYRSFMRGKEADLTYFFENDDIVAYGATPYDIWSFDNYYFEIAVLDKNTNKTTAFSAPIPNRSDYYYVEPYGINYTNQELSIVTMNEKVNNTDGNDSTEIHLYTFDIEEERLLNEELITELSSVSSENGYESIDILFDENANDGNVIVLQTLITYIEPTTSSEDYTETIETKKVLQYNLMTNESKEISLPKGEHNGMPFAVYNEQLYLASVVNDSLQLTSHSLNDDKTKESLEIQMPLQDLNISLGDIHGAVIKDDTLYYVPSYSNYGEMASIIVVDLPTFTQQYYGEIENTNPPINGEQIDMYFQSPELRH